MTLYQKQSFGVNTKVTFLNGVDGNTIVRNQDLINESPNQCVVSTQIQPRMTMIENVMGPQRDIEGMQIYDAWIYYEVSSQSPKGDMLKGTAQPPAPKEEFNFD